MGGLFSGLSKQFLTTLALSAGLPAAVFVLLASLFLIPLLPEGSVPSEGLEALGAEWKTVVATGAVVLVAALLVNLNVPIIRFYEGYPWKESAWGTFLGKRKKARFRDRHSFWRGTRTLLRALPADSPYWGDLYDRWNSIGEELVGLYPSSEERVLPTRLGNVIRAFEDYPKDKYGIYAVTTWPRLVACIDKEYAGMIEQAKSSVDFMLNSSVLSAVLGGSILVAGLVWPTSLFEPVGFFAWLAAVMLLGAGAYLLYSLAVSRAAAWGGTVKTAFDLYRWDLLKALGFEHRPATQTEERKLWERITSHMLFGRLATYPPLGYVPPYAEGGSDLDQLELTRTVAEDDRGRWVTLRVKNPSRSQATGAAVVESLDGGVLVGEPVREDSGEIVKIEGVNPHRLVLGQIDAGCEASVRYQVEAPKKKG